MSLQHPRCNRCLEDFPFNLQHLKCEGCFHLDNRICLGVSHHNKAAEHKSHIERLKGNILQIYRRPDDRVLRKITLQFASNLIVCCDDPDSAVELYRTAALLPNTTTVAQIQSAAHITVNGPLNPDLSYILTAVGRDGQQLLVKILRYQAENYKVSKSVQEEMLAFEAALVDQLQLALDATSPYNLVAMNAVQVNLPSLSVDTREESESVGYATGKFDALVMPRYICTVASAPRFSYHSLFEGGKRMVQALEFLHSKEIAHLDIKGGNIFVDQPGRWWLGDFGSARSFAADSNHTVITTTDVFYPYKIYGSKPRPQVDWYMLCVTLCLASVDVKMMTRTFQSPVSDIHVRSYVEALDDEGTGLAALLTDLLQKHDTV